MTKILLVEDEPAIREFIKVNLQMEDYQVFEAGTGEEGLELAKKVKPDVVLLDVMLPGIDGFQVCKVLRAEHRNMGIIMLTAKSQDMDKIQGLEAGSDDYISKPFNPKELILRIKSLERRLGFDEKVEEEQGKFRLDNVSRKIYKDDKILDLTPTEYEIMMLFINNPDEVIPRDKIMDKVWGDDFLGDSKIVDVNIRRLRSKIEDDPSNPKYICTVWGVGYLWDTSSE